VIDHVVEVVVVIDDAEAAVETIIVEVIAEVVMGDDIAIIVVMMIVVNENKITPKLVNHLRQPHNVIPIPSPPSTTITTLNH
jgi:hypothetical protein